MRKVIYSAAVTLDGYIARPDGSVDYLVMTKDGEKLMRDFFARFDTVLMGRKTATVEGGGVPQGPWKTYVFSRTRPPGERAGVTWVNQSPAALVRKLRKQRGKDIFLMGGGDLARSFIQDDLVDELFIAVLPILLGQGIPVFPPTFPQRDFRLAGTKIYDGSSAALTYKRVRTKMKKRVRVTKVQ